MSRTKTKSKTKSVSPIRGGRVVDGCYKIVEAGPKGRTLQRQVEPIEIAYDVIGIRADGKRTVLDHIPTGQRIASFPREADARQAVRELIQATDFRWSTPPAAIKPDVKEILERLAA